MRLSVPEREGEMDVLQALSGDEGGDQGVPELEPVGATDAARAVSILDGATRRGLVEGERVLAHVLEHQPTDFLVAGRALRFGVDDRGCGVRMSTPSESWGLHRHAMGQVAGRASVPLAYADRLSDGEAEPWQRRLLEEILGRSYGNMRSRYLVRAVGGEVRGFLSDRYRRLDSRPLLEAFVQESTRAGAVPYGGAATDLRTALRVIRPQPLEIAPGEFVVLGLEWGNSDYGSARYTLSEFVLRVACLNGMTATDMIGQVHLGGRLAESIEFSRKTYSLDTSTALSATRDVVRSALGERHQATLMQRIQASGQVRGSFDRLAGRALKSLSKDEARKVKEAFEGPDVVNLPPEPTAWRMGQAISWVAKSGEVSGDRRLELERLSATVAQVG